MKLTKILVALSFLFAVSTANAGEMTVTGNMEATYNSQSGGTTGNPLGMDRELKFSASTELDNGVTVSVMQDTSDALVFADGQIEFGGIMGMFDVYVGADGSPVDAIDDVTPTAYEEANGAGSGTLNDIGGLAGEMGIGIKFTVPGLDAAVNAKYIPKVDGAENADNATSTNTNAAVGSGRSISVKLPLGNLPVLGGYMDGAMLTGGYEIDEVSTVAAANDLEDGTLAFTMPLGNFNFGIQRKAHFEGGAASGAQVHYKDLAIGLAYSVNDALSISYNTYESKRHNNAAVNPIQETDAINIGYTVGGMTIGLQEASTDNAGWVQSAEDDSRTIGISVAF
jgi:hypothetical protein